MPALITYRTQIQEDWVDYNGHLRDAFYLLIFSYATDALMERIGLDADSRGQTGHSLFTLEAHVNYLHEVKLGTEVWVQTRVLSFDQKRLQLFHSLHREGFEPPLSASEQMLLHVDLVGPKAAPFSTKTLSHLQRLMDSEQGTLAPNLRSRAFMTLEPADRM